MKHSFFSILSGAEDDLTPTQFKFNQRLFNSDIDNFQLDAYRAAIDISKETYLSYIEENEAEQTYFGVVSPDVLNKVDNDVVKAIEVLNEKKVSKVKSIEVLNEKKVSKVKTNVNKLNYSDSRKRHSSLMKLNSLIVDIMNHERHKRQKLPIKKL